MNHGDTKPCSFLIDPETRQISIIYFGDVSVLPLSFVSFTLYICDQCSVLSQASLGLCALLGKGRRRWERLQEMSGSKLGTLHLTAITGLDEDQSGAF